MNGFYSLGSLHQYLACDSPNGDFVLDVVALKGRGIGVAHAHPSLQGNPGHFANGVPIFIQSSIPLKTNVRHRHEYPSIGRVGEIHGFHLVGSWHDIGSEENRLRKFFPAAEVDEVVRVCPVPLQNRIRSVGAFVQRIGGSQNKVNRLARADRFAAGQGEGAGYLGQTARHRAGFQQSRRECKADSHQDAHDGHNHQKLQEAESGGGGRSA